MAKRDGGSGSMNADASQKESLGRSQDLGMSSAPTGQDPMTTPVSGENPSEGDASANQRSGK